MAQVRIGLCLPADIPSPAEECVRAIGQDKAQLVKSIGCNLYLQRNAAVSGQHMVGQSGFPFEWYLSVDGDTRFGWEHVEALMAKNALVVSAACPRRDADAKQLHAGHWSIPGLIGTSLSTDSAGLARVDWCGGGMLLIHRTVFERLEHPWFDPFMVEWGLNGARCQIRTSADFGFCIKCRAAGIPVYVDCDTRVEHRPYTDAEMIQALQARIDREKAANPPEKKEKEKT